MYHVVASFRRVVNMVAPKRGRGAKAAQAKAKAAVQEEQPQPAAEQGDAEGAADDTVEPMEENNGAAEAGEAEGAGEAAAGEPVAEGADQTPASDGAAPADEEPKPEEPKEEKVEPGKILVENLPTSLLFDYQDRVKEIFSKHGEVISVK